MKVIIGGAGITGLAVSSYLQSKDFEFQIFEQSSKPLFSQTGIQLASNCHFVFKELGIYEQIKDASIERKFLKVYSEKKFLNEISVTNKNDEGTLFIRRSELLAILTSLIPSDKILSSKKVSDILSIDDGVSLNVDNTQLKADFFIDCMGANSFIAKNSHATNSNAVWGISDYSDESFKSFNNFMYEGMHFVTYPLKNNQTAYTLVFSNAKLALYEEKNITTCTLNKLLKNQFEDLLNNSKGNVIKAISTSKINKWGSGNILYLGDSAHAITPHLAQGAAQGLIDAAFLNTNFNKKPDLKVIFKQRNSIINKIRSESKLNKNRYQMGMPFKLLRNLYLKLYKPNYDWLFNSKYEA